jgi:hypothetical protein
MLRGLKKDGPRGLAQSGRDSKQEQGNAAAKGNNGGRGKQCGTRQRGGPVGRKFNADRSGRAWRFSFAPVILPRDALSLPPGAEIRDCP